MAGAGIDSADVRVVELFDAAAEALRSELSQCQSYPPPLTSIPVSRPTSWFAVKLQGMDDIVLLRRAFDSGCRCPVDRCRAQYRFLRKHLGRDIAIVRTMPNTPAAVGRGITAACANDEVSVDQRSVGWSLLEAIGEVVWVEDASDRSRHRGFRQRSGLCIPDD